MWFRSSCPARARTRHRTTSKRACSACSLWYVRALFALWSSTPPAGSLGPGEWGSQVRCASHCVYYRLGLELLRTCVATFTPTAVLQVLDADAPAEALAFGAIPVYPLFSQVSLHGPKPPKHATAAQVRATHLLRSILSSLTSASRLVMCAYRLTLGSSMQTRFTPIRWPSAMCSSRECASQSSKRTRYVFFMLAAPLTSLFTPRFFLQLAPDMVFMALHETVVALVHSPSWIERRGTFCTGNSLCFLVCALWLTAPGRFARRWCTGGVWNRARLLQRRFVRAHPVRPVCGSQWCQRAGASCSLAGETIVRLFRQ